jgi:hypothetical protein
MDFSKLEQNIVDMIQEEQIKLGYRKETISLYYPLSSLNRLLHAEYSMEEMTQALKAFSVDTEERLGTITISNTGERFCLCFLPQATEYVHEHTESDGFLYDLIHTVSRHDISMEDVIQQFRKYSDCLHVEKMKDGEFDVLIYFEDGIMNDYRYCFHQEGHHIIYHRFTKEDYEDYEKS